MTGGVDRDDLVVACQVGGDAAPRPPGLGEAVDEHERVLSPRRDVQPHGRHHGAHDSGGGDGAACRVGVGSGHVLRHPGRRVGPRRRDRRGGRARLAVDAAGAGPGRRRPRRASTSHHDERSAGFLALGARPGHRAPGRRAHAPAARPRSSSTPRSSRPTRPRCRCSCAPPTARPSCTTSARPRPSTRPHLFGGAVRWFADPGVARRRAGGRRGARSPPGRCRAATGGRRPGPGAPQPAVPRAAGGRGRAAAAGPRPTAGPWHGRWSARRRRPGERRALDDLVDGAAGA